MEELIYDDVKSSFIDVDFSIEKYEEFIDVMKVFLDSDTTYLSFGEYFDILKNNVNPDFYGPEELTKHLYFMNMFVQIFKGMSRDQIVLLIDENAEHHKNDFMDEFINVVSKKKPTWTRQDIDDPIISLDILNPFSLETRIIMEFPHYVDRRNTFHLWAFNNLLNKISFGNGKDGVDIFSYVSITSTIMSRVPYFTCSKEKLYHYNESNHSFNSVD